MSACSANWLRAIRMAAPWSPSTPFVITTSPGRAWPAETDTPRGTTPIPAVLMNSLSAAPRSTTLVSPVTMATPAWSATRLMLATTRRRMPTSSPSSSTTPHDRNSGRAPLIARSFTVPATASVPMSPPGKNSGSTT